MVRSGPSSRRRASRRGVPLDTIESIAEAEKGALPAPPADLPRIRSPSTIAIDEAKIDMNLRIVAHEDTIDDGLEDGRVGGAVAAPVLATREVAATKRRATKKRATKRTAAKKRPAKKQPAKASGTNKQAAKKRAAGAD